MGSWRFLLFPAALLFATVCSAQEYVPALSPNCVIPTYVRDGNRFTNDCGVPVYVSIVFGNLRTGAYGMHLAQGESRGTGHSEAMTDRLGGAFPHVCPEGSSPVDAQNKPVYRIPVNPYRCRKTGATINGVLGLNTPAPTDAPTDLEAQALAKLSGNSSGAGQASTSGASLEQQALAKLGGSSAATPASGADLERQALDSLANAQAVMAQAQATMDAQARGQYAPNQPIPLTVVFRGDGTDTGSDLDAIVPMAATVNSNTSTPDLMQQTLQQQLQNIQQVANAIQQRQAQPANAPAANTSPGTAGPTLCAHTKVGEACRAQ